MTSTTERYPIKAKSLTLLELCQSIHDFRNPSSRNTAQILTRRLYLHPLTINPNAKIHAAKISADFETHDEQKKNSLHRRRSQRDFTLHSSSVPLLTRLTTKLNTSIAIEEDPSNHDFETSQSTFTSNHISLPPVIKRKKTPPKPKRSISTRPSQKFHPKKVKPLRPKLEKVNVWEELESTLQRPVPQDPPTTPFHDLSELYFEQVDGDLNRDEDETDDEYRSTMFNSIQEIKIFKRTHRSDHD